MPTHIGFHEGGAVGHIVLTLNESRPVTDCDHNLTPCSRWLRTGWVCVRCDRWFRDAPSRRPGS